MATTQETIEKKSCWSNFVLWKKWGFNELQKFVYIRKESLPLSFQLRVDFLT
jgi:hypothetical protein